MSEVVVLTTVVLCDMQWRGKSSEKTQEERSGRQEASNTERQRLSVNEAAFPLCVNWKL